MRKLLRLTLNLAGLLFAFILLGRGIGAFLERDPRGEIPPCFEMREDVHHRFRPNCRGEVRTSKGTISLVTNEDGLRDAPRAEILRKEKRVLVLGDSFVEGWWLESGETVSALLSRKFPYYFVNAGLRSTGPVLQSLQLERLLPIYRPVKILWFVHDTDYADDRLACATYEKTFTLEEFRPSRIVDFAAFLWGGENPLVHGIKQEVYRRNYRAILDRPEAGSCDPCRGFRAVRDLAARYRVPLKTVMLGPVPEKEAGPYLVSEEARGVLLKCLEESGLDPLVVEFPGRRDLYWPGDFHFHAKGMEEFVRYLEPRLAL